MKYPVCYTAGSNIETRVARDGETWRMTQRKIIQTTPPAVLGAAQIGTNRISDAAAALFEKRFSMKLPENKITHMRTIALGFDVDGFRAREEAFREIRFYENKGEEPFVFSGALTFMNIPEYEKWVAQGKGEAPRFRNTSAYTKWIMIGKGAMPSPFPADIFDDERKFLQNKGDLLGTVWAKKHGNEVRFYFPMPNPGPALQSAGKPAAKPDTKPPAQKPAAQSGVQKPSAAQKR